jgi:DNA-binding transcriptional LysR family regulator
LRFSNAEACIAAAEAGLGVVHAPTFVAGPRVRAGALTRVLRDFEEPPRGGVHILYPPARHLALKVRALVDFLVTRFRGEPPWDQDLQGAARFVPFGQE